ncbi:MAG: rhomboid family intramembrane serine protease [Bacteroidaceae bacterium]
MKQMPLITKNLIIINVIVYLAQLVCERNGIDLPSTLGLHFVLADDFMPYQLVTYMFLHGGWSHLFFNMFALWMFGRTMEQVWGQKRFLFYFLVCGVGAGVLQEVSQGVNFWLQGYADYQGVNVIGFGQMAMGEFLNTWTTIGASGACYAILLGFGMTFPEERIMLLLPPIPIKAKYFVMGYALIELFSGLDGANDKVAHFAHLGGMLFGFFIILYWRRHDKPKTSTFTSWATYQPPKKSFVERMKKRFQKEQKVDHPYAAHQQDYDYNAKRKATQDELNKILEKIKKSGYDSLTDGEKKKLFDVSKKK